MQVANLKKPEQHTGFHPIRAQPMNHALQVFLVAADTAMLDSPALAATGAGGVLRRTIQALPGNDTWIAAVAMYTGSATGKSVVFLSVA